MLLVSVLLVVGSRQRPEPLSGAELEAASPPDLTEFICNQMPDSGLHHCAPVDIVCFPTPRLRSPPREPCPRRLRIPFGAVWSRFHILPANQLSTGLGPLVFLSSNESDEPDENLATRPALLHRSGDGARHSFGPRVRRGGHQHPARGAGEVQYTGPCQTAAGHRPEAFRRRRQRQFVRCFRA